MEIDEIDEKILNLLLDNAKMSYRDISKSLRVSLGTVANRIRNLEKIGVIKNYSTVIDYEKIDYEIEVIIDVKISKGNFLNIANKIINHPNVFIIYDLTGDFDAAIIARFRRKRNLDNFIKQLQSEEAVQHTSTKLILNTIRKKTIRRAK